MSVLMSSMKKSQYVQQTSDMYSCFLALLSLEHYVHCILCNLELRSLHKLRDYTNIALTFHTDLKRPQSICHHSNLIPFVNQVNTFFQRLVCRLSKTSSNWQVLTDRIRQVEEIEVLSSSGTPGPALNCLIYLKATMHLLANCYLHIIYSSYRYLLL